MLHHYHHRIIGCPLLGIGFPHRPQVAFLPIHFLNNRLATNFNEHWTRKFLVTVSKSSIVYVFMVTRRVNKTCISLYYHSIFVSFQVLNIWNWWSMEYDIAWGCCESGPGDREAQRGCVSRWFSQPAQGLAEPFQELGGSCVGEVLNFFSFHSTLIILLNYFCPSCLPVCW